MDLVMPENWTVLVNDSIIESLDSDDEVMRDFVLHDGGGNMAAPQTQHDPVLAMLKEAHREEIVRIREIHREEVDRLYGNRWTASASLRALVVSEGPHRFNDKEVLLEVTVANPSPYAWTISGGRANNSRWAGLNENQGHLTWRDLNATVRASVQTVGRDGADVVSVRFHLTATLQRALRGVQRLAFEPGDLVLEAHRSNTTQKEELPVHFSGGQIVVSREP